MSNNDYIIDNDDWDSPQTVKNMTTISSEEKIETVQSRNSLPEGIEIIEEIPKQEQIRQDIEELAIKEGFAGKSDLGGEGASPEDVIKALRNEAMPDGALKAKEEHEDKKLKEFREVTATRDLLFGRLQEKIKISIPMGHDQHGNPVNGVFYAKRLSESENNHLLNHQLIGKNLNELSESEYEESIAFRRKMLAATIVEPKLTEAEWGSKVDTGIMTKLFDEVQKKTTTLDDGEIFL